MLSSTGSKIAPSSSWTELSHTAQDEENRSRSAVTERQEDIEDLTESSAEEANVLAAVPSSIAVSDNTDDNSGGAFVLNSSFFQTTNAAVPKMPSRAFTEDELALDDINLKYFANSIIPRKTTDGNLSLPSSLSSSLPPLYTSDEKPFIDDAIAMNKQRLAVDYGWKRQSSDHYACK